MRRDCSRTALSLHLLLLLYVAAASAAPEAARLSAVSHEVLSLAADLPIRCVLKRMNDSVSMRRSVSNS